MTNLRGEALREKAGISQDETREMMTRLHHVHRAIVMGDPVRHEDARFFLDLLDKISPHTDIPEPMKEVIARVRARATAHELEQAKAEAQAATKN